MKMLIVGATSSVAHTLIPLLESMGEVTTAGRSGADVHLDLEQRAESIAIPAGTDVVINTAAHFGGNTQADILAAASTNAIGTLRLCQAAIEAGVGHIVQISSMFADLQADSPFFGPYSLSKRHADELAELSCATGNLALTVLRPARLYGKGEGFRRHQPFLYRLLEQAQRGEEISIYGSNDARRWFLHINDIAQIIALVVRHRIAGRYDCLPATPVSCSEIAALAFDAFGQPRRIRFLPDKPNIADDVIPAGRSAPGSDLYEKLQFQPGISMQAGILDIASSWTLPI
ncbi:NAD-dependent epimerase/dehydratase family protein [Herbaspirillum sp. NPDC087042]|uniref:NAD-dependent epimerase/dehydratase family protein n=1 Tax=Herbaspirillum sp. NPDC087042 TaxID=3364004 RepID=UPI003822F9C0